MASTVYSSADVDDTAQIGDGTTVWHLAQVRERARIGKDCTVGRGAYVGPGVVVGDRVKIQNYALVYEPAVLENEVFIGPAAVLTNDLRPRAATLDGRLKGTQDWSAVGVVVRHGASLGAGVTVVAPVTVGQWAIVGAGSVVTRNVPDYSLSVGSPARHVAWVGRSGGTLLPAGAHRWRDPLDGRGYDDHGGELRELAR